MKVILNEGGLAADDPRLAAAAPDATFVVVNTEDELRDQGRDAEVCWGGRWLPTLLAHAPGLQWVASMSAGVEGYLRHLAERPEIRLTSGAGTFDVPIAEHLMALLLALRRGLPESFRAQQAHEWHRRGPLGELRDTTLGIIGLGHIGSELARMASAGFGMNVLAYRRQPSAPPPGVAEVFSGRDGLLAMMRRCDQVAVTAALTPETRGLLDAEALDCLPPHAVITNIVRGAIIDQAALTERLADGRLAGAGLDVFAPEPLPSDDPLWDLPNVIVTPHHAGSSVHTGRRKVDLFIENLRRYASGEPLLNEVDRSRGY